MQIPVGVSNRHIHLTNEHVQILFGHELTNIKMLSQPGVFASAEMVTVVGPKGEITGVRVLGPTRPETQLEILLSDTFKLGIPTDLRLSGDLIDTPGTKLIGPTGTVNLTQGVIVALRHLHMSPSEALEAGLKDGDTISLRSKGKRAVIFENVIVRSGNAHSLDLHIDTEEANAAGLKTGDFMEIVK